MLLSRLGASFTFPVCICMSHSFLLQKSLPILENQINENHQIASEELQKYGADIPEDDSKRLSFLMNVSIGCDSHG